MVNASGNIEFDSAAGESVWAYLDHEFASSRPIFTFWICDVPTTTSCAIQDLHECFNFVVFASEKSWDDRQTPTAISGHQLDVPALKVGAPSPIVAGFWVFQIEFPVTDWFG